MWEDKKIAGNLENVVGGGVLFNREALQIPPSGPSVLLGHAQRLLGSYCRSELATTFEPLSQRFLQLTYYLACRTDTA